MVHDTDQQTVCSTTTVVLAVVAGMVFFFFILAVGVGALFYTRASRTQQHAIVAREHAVREAERARQFAEEARVQAEAERDRAEAVATTFRADKTSDITVSISEDGDVTLDGDPVGVDNLQTRLAAAQGQPVIIEADPQCPFKDVAEVLAICRKAEIEGVQVRMTEGAPPKK